MTLAPFTLDVLNTHKAFYALHHINPNAGEFTVTAESFYGRQPVDFVDLFLTPDNRVVAAWSHPFKHLPIHQVWVGDGNTEEVVNLTTLERIIDIYDKPVDDPRGAFTFVESIVAVGPQGEWRCDVGGYTGIKFADGPSIAEHVNELKYVEMVLSVNATAHLVYAEKHDGIAINQHYVSGHPMPTAGRTVQEVLRLIWEWAESTKEPLNNTEPIAVKAREFLSAMRLTAAEEAAIAAQTPMQVSRYLMGHTDARMRPEGVQPLSADIRRLVFRRMASSTFAALTRLHNGLWDTQEVLETEEQKLAEGIARFRSFYNLDSSVGLDDEDAIVAAAVELDGSYGPYVLTQLRNFANKRLLLDLVANDNI